jgi:APA family basic amino acid/polyamine antiporter
VTLGESASSGPGDHPLRPTLGLLDATAVGVGAIIGAGIFVVTGIAAAHAGSALVVSMLVAASISFLTALSFAELTAWLPREGSVYEFARRLLSPFAGFATGWMWLVSNVFAGAAVALGLASYLGALAPALPVKWVAVAACLSFAALNHFGVRASAILNNWLVGVKLLILLAFCLLGALYVRGENFRPFAPTGEGVLYGAVFIFFAYGGFARVAVIAEEVRDASRTVPRAILLSLAVSTAFYVVVGFVAVGLVGAARLSTSSSPLAMAIGATGIPAAAYVVSVGGIVATASVLLTSVLGVSRLAYAMARDGDLPDALAILHPRHRTPARAIWLTGLLMAALILLIDLGRVVAVSTFSLLLYYAIANVCALRLERGARRYARAVPLLGVTSCLFLLAAILFISPRAWLIGVGTLAGGTSYYLLRRRVLLRQR